MKKVITFCLTALISLAALAQTEPNRIIINKPYSLKAFSVEHTDSITFAVVEGKVAADVKFLGYRTGSTGDTLNVAVTKTPECKSYHIACMPKNLADKITDDAVAENYFERYGGQKQTDDFTNAEMTGFSDPFKASTSYALITLGYDKYGVACSMSRADFTTPDKPLVGNPKVTGVVLNTTATTIEAKFTPNEDVAGYAYCIFKAGTAEQQFEQFGPMMGLSNMGDMIKKWGVPATEEQTYTWKSMIPNTAYEIYVQAWDVNDTYTPMLILPASTKKLGGAGIAQVSIEIKEFESNGDGYTQRVIYTPNDQCSLHRDILMTKEYYDKPEMGDNGVIAFLEGDNPQDPNWDQYGVDNVLWNANPSTTYYAFSIAKNVNDEWGPLTRVEFTTPASAGAKPAMSKAMPKRVISQTGVGVTKAPIFVGSTSKPVMKLEKK